MSHIGLGSSPERKQAVSKRCCRLRVKSTYWCDGSLSSPVDRGGQVSLVQKDDAVVLLGGAVVCEVCREFLSGPVSELVDGHGVASACGLILVVIVDDVDVLGEHLEPLEQLGLGLVNLVKLGLELAEHVGHFRVGCTGSSVSTMQSIDTVDRLQSRTEWRTEGGTDEAQNSNGETHVCEMNFASQMICDFDE